MGKTRVDQARAAAQRPAEVSGGGDQPHPRHRGIKAEPEAVVLYARVSTKKQADAGNLKRELERLRAYAREKGYHVVAEHSDVASGLNQNRRGLERVLKSAERGEFRKLICTARGVAGKSGRVFGS